VVANDQLDATWMGVVLDMIGETLDPDNVICGVRIVDKSPIKVKQDKKIMAEFQEQGYVDAGVPPRYR
jgi:hypothetical protein